MPTNMYIKYVRPATAMGIAAMAALTLFITIKALEAQDRTPVPQTDFGAEAMVQMLEDRGYSHIILKKMGPPYRFAACQGSKLYALKIDPMGEIIRRAETGLCSQGHRAAAHAGIEASEASGDNGSDLNSALDAAGVKIERDDGPTHIKAPRGTDIKIDKDRIKIRVPFIDLDIKRR